MRKTNAIHWSACNPLKCICMCYYKFHPSFEMQSRIIVNYVEFPYLGAVQRSIVVATKCSGCNEVVSVGQMAIFTEKLGCEACWHPQCFRCFTDGDLLIDLLYFVFNQKLYCARHWSEQIKPRCHACEEVSWVSIVIQCFKEMLLLKTLRR